MGHRTDFLYMSEPDVIAAGVLDARKCIDNAEEVFKHPAHRPSEHLCGSC